MNAKSPFSDVFAAVDVVVSFVEIQTFCYHGNVTSQFSSLLETLVIGDPDYFLDLMVLYDLPGLPSSVQEGKQEIKFANKSNHCHVSVFSQNVTTINGYAKCTVWVLRRYCLPCRHLRSKSNNDHLHPYFAIVRFKIKSSSFSVVAKQRRLRFLELANFISCYPPTPEKPRDTYLIPPVL